MSRRGRASEDIAFRFLEEFGYRVIETRKRVVVDGVEVGEVDAIAVDGEGVKWAVEVKAGALDVNDVRQAFVNAMLVGAKPLIVCRGYANEAARKVAEKLGVKVIVLSDWFLVDSVELALVVESVFERVLERFLKQIVSAGSRVREDDVKLLRVLAESSSIVDAAERLGAGVEDVARLLASLRERGVLGNWRGWIGVRLGAYAALLGYMLRKQISLNC
ncbi:MAG TPA: recombinase RecB [Pyrodictium sp.]|nr:recombinase RecB [Pyrodictium sp.]